MTPTPTAGPILASIAEKAITTYVQAFLTILLAGDVLNTSSAQAAAIAAIPALLSALLAALPTVPVGLPFYVDLVLRAIRTYVVSFLGFAIAVPVFRLDYSILVAASAAALPAALAVIKGGIASKFGAGTAALLPAKLDTSSPSLALAA